MAKRGSAKSTKEKMKNVIILLAALLLMITACSGNSLERVHTETKDFASSLNYSFSINESGTYAITLNSKFDSSDIADRGLHSHEGTKMAVSLSGENFQVNSVAGLITFFDEKNSRDKGKKPIGSKHVGIFTKQMEPGEYTLTLEETGTAKYDPRTVELIVSKKIEG